MGIPWKKLFGWAGKHVLAAAEKKALDKLQRRAEKRRAETLVADSTGRHTYPRAGVSDLATRATYGEDLED